ncbi:MAG: carboxy-S-adenosyl-L-methionine synthase CmoA [Wenzhouxiangella sp.]|nr:MAG: carboxy-S-adenosyl-L-methionine synthase CmoA [Wenzhouxiangella sp.]
MSDRDRLFAAGDAPATPFEFSRDVVRVFPDMIERSVPGYRLLLELTPLMVARAVQPDSRIYDLGCSLGAATLAARRAVQAKGVEIIAIDSAPEMVGRCRQIMAEDNSRIPVEVIEGDACSLPIENASVVLMYFTLQFIAREQRDALMARIAAGLRPGGVLLLAEKLAFESPEQQDWLDTHHHEFKRAQGYSDLEIARKRQALENVLVPETRAAHHQRLRQAGFDQVIDWFQCFNFAAMAAIKRD